MPNQEFTTVMGPGPSVAPNKMFDPPKLLPTTDKLIWRKEVRMWARTVKTLAKGGDTKAVGAYKAMGFTLYQSIDDTYAGKLEAAIVTGTLKIEPDDEEETDPMDTVETVIQLVAKDSITDTCRREASMLKEIHACKRKDGESAAAFAHRYEGMALKYLNNCEPLGAKQISKTFAVTLLDNAKISPSVYSTILSQMVARANERGHEEEKMIVIPKENAKKAVDGLSSLIEGYRTHKVDNEITLSDTEDPMMKQILQTRKIVAKLNEQNPHQESTDRPNACITLEDAVQALSHVTVEQNAEKPMVGSMLGKRAYGSFTGPESCYNKSGYDKKQKKDQPPFDPSKGRCRMCKQKGHFFRDPICIFNQVRELLKNQNNVPDSKTLNDKVNNSAAHVCPTMDYGRGLS